jgi:predicted nucleic acid-binding protein
MTATNFFDTISPILAAAHELGCETLFARDLSHGQIYGSVKVLNPFL